MALATNLEEAAIGEVGLVHQALHGYRDGHRLLASSVPLPQTALDAMLSLTDAVDVYDDEALGQLLAIYPLPDTEWIAASLTWPATDVGRAGAVWTHTLIATSLTFAAAGPAVGELFRRPASATRTDLSGYDVTLGFGRSPKIPTPSSLDSAARIAWALHEAPIRPVIADASAIKSELRQRLLIGLVTQCWPGLIETLACGETSSLPRQLGSRPFDLTLTGRRGLAVLSRDTGLRVLPASTKIEPPAWATKLASEAFQRDGLTRFLRSFGPEAAKPRTAVKPLAQTFTELSGEPDSGKEGLESVLKILSSVFPRRADMPRLKIAIFGSAVERDLTKRIRETDILAVVATDSHSRCLSTVDLKLGERAAHVAATSPEDTLRLLRALATRDGGRDTARVVYSGLLAGLSAEDLRGFASSHPDTLASLITIYPGTLERAELWQNGSVSLLDALEERAVSPELRRSITTAAGRVADRELAHVLFDRWPREVEASLTDIFVQREAFETWAGVLPSSLLAGWLAHQETPSPVLVFDVASKLTVKEARRVPTDIWLRTRLGEGTGSSDERALATLLCMALTHESTSAAELACRAADGLWPAVVADRLTRADVIDDLGKLRKAPELQTVADGIVQRLVKSFRKHHWHTDAALLLSHRDLFELVLETDAAMKPEGTIAQRLLSHLSSAVSPGQVDVMEAVVARHAPREDLVRLVEGFVRRFTSGW